jgi:hypothetical protein
MSKTQFTRDDLPPGCMISLAATHVAPALDSIRDMAGHRALSEATLAERLRKGVAECRSACGLLQRPRSRNSGASERWGDQGASRGDRRGSDARLA